MRYLRLAAILIVLQSAIRNPQSAIGQEVQWRTNYDAARREATEKGRPILIDFVTDNCFFCKKLDAATFSNETVAALLNERFVPLKIDAARDVALAQALHVDRYPTLVLGSAEGIILESHVGYLDPEPFLELLKRNLARLTDPEPMVRDFQLASRAKAAGDYSRAVSLLKGIVQDGKTRPVQTRARQALQELEQQAAARLTYAQELLDRGQHGEAVDAFTELARAFNGTQAANEGERLLTVLAGQIDVKALQRVRRARELLAQAREDFRTQQYLCCLDRCELLAASYADLPEAAEGVQLMAQIKTNPEWLTKTCESLSDRLGGLYLALAETWLKKGQPQQAVMYLERVVKAFPGTRQAEAAQIRLSQILEQPTTPVNFKK
jgi:thioredoxin-related protein/outer membrane protein assembly factor BamD (BamD/ComL family)